MKTGGLAGTWKASEVQIPSGTSSSEYYFGLNSGQLTININQSQGGSSINSEIEMDFNYAAENGSKLTVSMQRVTIKSTTSVNGNTYNSTQGPYTWNEFVNIGQNQTGYTSQITEINYKLKDEGKTLEFSNGEVYSRQL